VAETFPDLQAPAATGPAPSRGTRLLHRAEDLLTVGVLGLMVLLPLVESFLRKGFHTGIASSMTFVQHLVLFVGMLGGALAAREGRLLSLSTATTYLKGRWKWAASLYSGSFAAAVTCYLFLASLTFVLAKGRTGEILANHIPLWAVLLVIPVGFGLVTLRILYHASDSWRGRLLTLLIAGAMVGAGAQPFVDPGRLVVPALVALIAATALGAPVFTALGGAALILFWGDGQAIAMISIDHYRLAVDATLPTIPLFTLAGYFLAEGGASRRLIGVFQALFGHVRGGPAIVTALVCALFTAFTGASGVTILALGGLLMPVLLAARYSKRDALGLVTSAGSLGLLFPPCLPLILYAVVATTIGTEISIGKMFLGGIVPGVLLVGLTAWWGVHTGSREATASGSFNAGEAGRALWEAKWELLIPVVALVSLFSGVATPVEASAITALYAFVVETLVYRDLDLVKDVPRVMGECSLLVGGVLLILGVAMGFTDYLFTANVPEKLVLLAREFIASRWVFLLALNLFLLVVGCLMDIFSAIVVVAPLIIPLGNEFGFDPVHLGIIFLANLELGFLTPPVGMNLFLSSYRFKKPMIEVTRSILPMLGILLIGVLLISYIPPLTTTLPRLFK
jgi:C4-dicarboxylate transporter, DctM subunit